MPAFSPQRRRYLFRSKKGIGPISRRHSHAILKKASREAGIGALRVGTHSRRKAFARALCDASGHKLLVVQRLLAHASPMSTARYLETATETLDPHVCGFDRLAEREVVERKSPRSPPRNFPEFVGKGGGWGVLGNIHKPLLTKALIDPICSFGCRRLGWILEGQGGSLRGLTCR